MSNNLQSNLSSQLQTIDVALTKKIDESAKTIEKNTNKSLEGVKNQIVEISQLTLSKLTNIKVSDKEIYDVIQIIQNKKMN